MNPFALTSALHSIVPDTDPGTATVPTQSSSSTGAHYRWVVLKRSRIFFDDGYRPLPADVQSRIDAVTLRKISQKRRGELSCIAKALFNDFRDVLNGASREDDCVEPIHRALAGMNHCNRFQFVRKAGIASLLTLTIPVCSLYLRLEFES